MPPSENKSQGEDDQGGPVKAECPAPVRPVRSWVKKFYDAFAGVYYGSYRESSFLVHLPAAIAVVAFALWLKCELWEWCTLIICIGAVISAELFNSSLESIVRGTVHQHNPQVGRGLDIASGAVLVISIASLIVGAIIFVPKLLTLFGIL